MEEIQIKDSVYHKFQRTVNDEYDFPCDYWDCPNKIKHGEVYYLELYPEGQVHQWCLECSAFFATHCNNELFDYIVSLKDK